GPFKALLDRVKRFEFRRDDRGYKVGDVLHLAEFDPAKEGGDYTGRVVLRRVTYKLPGGTFGVPEGFCVLSIEEYP
ncbi:MAG TPA: DUF3850 domain-containing protein, partial [Gemmatimonadaceae bacterium]|nr:DUF3850 domain-containing protein [Gemmatimonadaceae bacterium]